MPDFMPGQHYGDYVILDVDIDTGAKRRLRDAMLEAERSAKKGDCA